MQDFPDDAKRRIFAAALYGLLIFPRERGFVDAMVLKFVNAVHHGIDPIPTILAETIRSLNHCRRTGFAKFGGCAQLLHVWMRSHIKHKIPNYTEPWFAKVYPILKFSKGLWDTPVTITGWKLDYII